MQYGGILVSDYDAIKLNQHVNKPDQILRSLIKIGSDKLKISSDPSEALQAISKGLDQRILRQNEIKDKAKRILTLKYISGLHNKKNISD